MAASVAEGAKGEVEGAEAASPKCYLIVHNVSKKHNIGTLVRSAVAFVDLQLSSSQPGRDRAAFISFISISTLFK